MRNTAGLALAILLATPVAAISMPHVELAVHYRPTSEAHNVVRLTATNFGPGNAYVMTYHTAFALPQGRMTGRWIQVRNESRRDVAYKGRWVLLRSPDASSYTRISPGETIAADVDLDTEYVLPEQGTVTVSSSIAVMDRIPELDAFGEPENVPREIVESEAIEFSVRTDSPSEKVLAVSSVIQCNIEQSAATQKAVVGAQAASYEALNFLSSLYYMDPFDPEDPVIPRVHMKPHIRYQYWFHEFDDLAPQPPDPGAMDTDNEMIDQVVFATYARLIPGARTVCDSCHGYHPGARAWNEGDVIHLCPANFLDPVIGGVTSQAGTIAHEVSHRPDGEAVPTQDFSGVENRATAHALDRYRAVRSGANYEYFIMNVPLGKSGAR